MNDLFELWWKDSNAADFAGGDDSPHVASAAKELARSAFNDGGQMMLMRIVMRLNTVKREALIELHSHVEGTAARKAVAKIVNALGQLIVKVAEMEV